MKIGLVGYQGSGKSTLFELLTGVPSDPAQAHTTQSAMAEIPDERVARMCEIYQPKKVTMASLELVDTPGLARDQQGNAKRLAQIREADCLAVVAASFDGSDPVADLVTFEEDLLLADLDIVQRRVERLRESIKKPRPQREQEMVELEALEKMLVPLEEGKPVREVDLNEEQARATKAFQLLTQKPRLAVINVPDDETDFHRYDDAAPEGVQVVAAPLGLELELSRMSQEEREAFREEMGVGGFDTPSLVRKLMEVSGQMLFFTAGEKEVRTWLIHQGATALEAADGIHSDMARGFIRAETMSCEDLFRLGSERDVKAAGLMRNEPKDYVLKDGDIINIKFNV